MLVLISAPLLLAAVDLADVEEAIQAYKALDYHGAKARLLALVDEELPDEMRAEVLAYLARAHAVLEEPAKSELRFRQLLALAPDFEVAWEESPRIREAFSRAKRRYEKQLKRAARAEERREKLEEVKEPPESPTVTAAPVSAVTPPTATTPTTSPSTPTDESISKWWLIGGGAAITVAVGVIMAVTIGSSEDPARDTSGTWRLP